MSDVKTLIEREVGYKYISNRKREITRQDIDVFVELFGVTHPAYQDDAAAKELGFTRRVLPGPAHLPIVLGLLWPILSPKSIIVGTDKVVYLKPLYPGDIVSAEAELLRKRETSSGNLLGTYLWSIKNQNGEVISHGQNT